MVTNKEFSKLIENKKLTMFVGSAISSFSPSALESGGAVVNSLCERLLGKDSPRLWREKDVLLKSAFEVLFEHYPKKEHLLTSLQSSYSGCRPNPVHVAIARLLHQRKTLSVITTNYDCGIEEAYKRIAAKELTVVVDDASLPSDETKDDPVLFKIHGCVDHPTTIVATLSDEAELPPWKKDLLHALLDDTVLLVMGYSGLDFEVCPELANVNVSQLFWNCRSEESKTGNSDIVVTESNGEYIYGDMCDVLSEITEKVSATWETKDGDLARLLLDELSEYERCLWITKLLVNQSCANAALEYSTKLRNLASNESEKKDANRLYLSSLYHLARHSTAVKERKIIRKSINKSTVYYTQLLYEDVGNLYTSGRYLRCFLRCRKAEKLVSKDSSPEHYLITNALPWMYALLYSVPLKSLFFKWIHLIPQQETFFRQRVIYNLSITCDKALEGGNWGSIYLCNDLAEKLDIPQSEYLKSRYSVPSAEKGFKQIGNIVGQMTALLHTPEDKKDSQHFSAVEEYIELSIYLGLNSATHMLISESVKYRDSLNVEQFMSFFPSLFRCEFSISAYLHYIIIYLRNYFNGRREKWANK